MGNYVSSNPTDSIGAADESTDQMLSDFERLPHEMIWRIIDFTPESSLILRATSRTLKLRADEYAVLQPAAELVTELRIMGPSERITPVNPSSRISVFMSVPLSKSIEFEHRLMVGTSHKPVAHLEMQKHKNMKIYRICVYIRNITETLEFLGTCIGRRIAKVSLSKCTDAAALRCVAKLLEGKHIDRLRVTDTVLTDEFPKLIVDSINVDKLKLDVKKVFSSDAAAILVSLSSAVRFIHVKQLAIEAIDSDSRYFLGVFDADWAPTIIDMFSGKLDKLYIDNYSFPDYLSRSSADALRESLPTLGKKIWFEASCDQYEDGLEYIENGYSVKAESSFENDRFLIIKPTSK